MLPGLKESSPAKGMNRESDELGVVSGYQQTNVMSWELYLGFNSCYMCASIVICDTIVELLTRIKRNLVIDKMTRRRPKEDKLSSLII